MNTVLVQYYHPVRTKQYTKNLNTKHAVKAEISMKMILLMTRRKIRHFPQCSGRMTWNSVCLWCRGEHGVSNKQQRQRRFKPSQETDVKKMIIGNVSSEFISLWYASVRCCKFYPKLRLASGFTLTKSTRAVTQQDLPLLNVTSSRPYATAEVTISDREYLKNYQK